MKNIIFFVLLTITCGLSCMETDNAINNNVEISIQHGAKKAKRSVSVDLELMLRNEDNPLASLFGQLNIDPTNKYILFNKNPVTNNNIVNILLTNRKPLFTVMKKEDKTDNDAQLALQLQDEELAQQLQEDQIRHNRHIINPTSNSEEEDYYLPPKKSYFRSCYSFFWKHKKKILLGTSLISMIGYWWYQHSKN